MKREKIILIDGSSYFFRAFYAITRLTNSKGFPTNAIYGFINMLIRVLEVEKPTKLAIAFDPPKPSFRKDLYKEYKANRSAPPEDLVKQIPHILRSVDCFNIRRFEVAGFEADDVIATFARRGEAAGYHVEIITGDKDLMQLVGPHITLYDTMKDKKTDVSGVMERFGVQPNQIADFLGLMGDSSDNIPGVTGIGEKTAAELIQQFGSLEGLYHRIDEIKQPKRRETLLREKENAFLSRELATVHEQVPLEIDWDNLNYRGPINEDLRAFCEEFDFHNLIKKFDLAPKEERRKEGTYQTVRTEAELAELVQKLRKAKVVSVDTETTSLNIQEAKLCGISLSGEANTGYYIPVGHVAPGGDRLMGQMDEERAREGLRPLLEDPAIPKIGQNLKYDLQILRNWGLELQGIAGDTLIASYLVDPESPHNLDHLALRYLGHQNMSYEEVAGKGKNQVCFSEVSIEKATHYSGEDADVTLQINEKLEPLLKERELMALYHDVEIPLLKVLAEMEFNGVLVDDAKLRTMNSSLESELETVQNKIYELAEGPININSPKQLSELLFGKLKLPVVRKTKTGLSTDESVLQKLRTAHPICEFILKFREFMKLKSTYVEGLLGQINPRTKRIHTSYNQTVAATGRLSSSNPNLQNIPALTGVYDIRSVFIPAPGKQFLSADYSQVELRLLADMSGDPELVRAFENDEDVHAATARGIFGKTSVTPEERRIAKTINFGVVYGQTPFGLAQQLSISPSEAKSFIDAYFGRYHGVRSFLLSLAEEARQKGYAVTRLGRRRYLPEINSQNKMRREMAERAAINTPLQGTAADMIKVAMVRLHAEWQKRGLTSRMVMQVHDELVCEVAEGEKSEVEALVRHTMESAMPLKIPLKVDVGWGSDWSGCK